MMKFSFRSYMYIKPYATVETTNKSALIVLCNWYHPVGVYKPVSQSCPVAKSEKFWQAMAQSYLMYERLAATKASNVWFPYSHNCTVTSEAVFHSVRQVWLSKLRPGTIVHFSLLCMIVKLVYRSPPLQTHIKQAVTKRIAIQIL